MDVLRLEFWRRWVGGSGWAASVCCLSSTPTPAKLCPRKYGWRRTEMPPFPIMNRWRNYAPRGELPQGCGPWASWSPLEPNPRLSTPPLREGVALAFVCFHVCFLKLFTLKVKISVQRKCTEFPYRLHPVAPNGNTFLNHVKAETLTLEATPLAKRCVPAPPLMSFSSSGIHSQVPYCMSLSCLLSFLLFSLSLLWSPWYFWRMLVRYLASYPSIWVGLMLSYN